MNNEVYKSVRLQAMEFAFECWWKTHFSPEQQAAAAPYKPLAKAAWRARDEHVMALSDLVQKLLAERKK
jgi:hypothetical protein